MITLPSRVDSRALAYSSLILGLIGLALCWWLPLGLVVSLAGFVVGIISLIRSAVHTRQRWFAIASTLFCLAVLVLGFVLGGNGWDLITFGALR